VAKSFFTELKKKIVDKQKQGTQNNSLNTSLAPRECLHQTWLLQMAAKVFSVLTKMKL